MAKKRHRCMNESCKCFCEKDTNYCSDECADADLGEEYCSCDHDECYPYSGIETSEPPIPER